MITRRECENAYRVMGKPKDKGHLNYLFKKAEQTYRINHKTCIKSIERNSDAHSELIEECDNTLEQDVTELRQALDFLKQYYSACDLGIKCTDSYAALGLRSGDKQLINAKYRTLTRDYHPDHCKGKDEVCREAQDKIIAAKKVLLEESCTEISGLEDFFVPNVAGADSQPVQDL